MGLQQGDTKQAITLLEAARPEEAERLEKRLGCLQFELLPQWVRWIGGDKSLYHSLSQPEIGGDILRYRHSNHEFAAEWG